MKRLLAVTSILALAFFARAEGPVKITFLGDVMCQGPMLKPYSTANGKYDFSEIFSCVKGLLSESDYVFANLETPIAPDNQNLTHERYAFCSPHEFAEAAKAAGIDFVFTANNHCLDRSPTGIPRTIEALDKIGLPHTGTFATAQDAAKPAIVDVKGFRIGVLSYTYGSNAFANNQYLSETNRFLVNLFQEQELANPLARAWSRNRNSEEGKRYVEYEKKNRPENLTLPVYERQEPHERERKELQADVARMKAAKPDFIVMGMHAGGQYNPVATKYTKELAEFIRGCGVDWIAGSHEHVVHGGDFSKITEGRLTTYSLGNFCGLNGVWETPFDKMGDYSIAWHLYLDRKADGTPYVAKTTFSVLKTIKAAEKGRIRVVPVADYYIRQTDHETRQKLRADLIQIAKAFSGIDFDKLGVCAEYPLTAASVPAVETKPFTVDKNVPAGNIELDRIEGNTVYVHQELRDTSSAWFYWAFRVTGAQGRKLDFRFTKSVAVGTRGPCVSLDKGKTWSYAAEKNATRNFFTYTFPADAVEVWFYETIPYLQTDWNAFLKRHEADRGKVFETGVLCKSRKGRDVERAVFGNLSGKPKYRIFLSARRHCSETMASFVLEGVLESVFAQDETGAWYRENVEIMAVPFMDKDGCEEGDQGKNRKPHDHNRDYTDFIYPETRGIRDWIAQRANNKLDIFFDFHCPWLYGNFNEFVYQVHEKRKENAEKTSRFGKILEGVQRGAMAYREKDDIRWGVGWNSDKNYTAGRAVKAWAMDELQCEFVSSFEIPFATANGKVVTRESCREFGGDIARAFRRYIETR
ncbi:MAG: CapA family protein [Kiritimatiellae bacterium]|nr:CapA family protein [Kiritimatiellia bacterium]